MEKWQFTTKPKYYFMTIHFLLLYILKLSTFYTNEYKILIYQHIWVPSQITTCLTLFDVESTNREVSWCDESAEHFCYNWLRSVCIPTECCCICLKSYVSITFTVMEYVLEYKCFLNKYITIWIPFLPRNWYTHFMNCHAKTGLYSFICLWHQLNTRNMHLRSYHK